MISVTGATYAYFALSATNETTITGTAATTGLSLTVAEAELKATNTGVMVPQLASAIGTAINTTNKCVDGNGNIVCKVYTITVTNNSEATASLNGTIAFVSATDGKELGTNLKWRRLQSTTAVSSTTTGSYAQAGVAASTSPYDLTAGTACTVGVSGCTDVSLAPGASAPFYIVVWINETVNSDQYGVDGDRTFTATISFTASNGKGITSTIIG